MSDKLIEIPDEELAIFQCDCGSTAYYALVIPSITLHKLFALECVSCGTRKDIEQEKPN